jgi:hypothetical protein
VPAEAYAAAKPAPAPAVTDVDGAQQSSTKDLESEVYTTRNVHGDDRVKLRRKLARARSSMNETSYRRALELARDSVLLTIEECFEGAQAMEWEPLPRPEFSLASIEAAVAEQERAEQVRASYERTEREVAEQHRAQHDSAEPVVAEREPAEREPAEPVVAEHEHAEHEPAEPVVGEPVVSEQERAQQERIEPEAAEPAPVAEQEPAEQESADQAEPQASGTSRRAG